MIKKKLVLAAIISLTSFTQSQTLTLKEHGESLHDLIPTGWEILDSKTGDLNKDGVLDLVFAIQDTDKKNYQLSDGLGVDTLDLNPRILGIYFGNKNGEFTKKLQSNGFIILRDSPAMDEPFEGFKISEKAVLEISFRFWYSVGSWFITNHTYKFRFQDNNFVLIGYDSNESHRASGEITGYSINFLTKKMRITKGNYSSDKPDTVEWRKFDLENKYTLETMKKPFESEFEEIQL